MRAVQQKPDLPNAVEAAHTERAHQAQQGTDLYHLQAGLLQSKQSAQPQEHLPSAAQQKRAAKKRSSANPRAAERARREKLLRAATTATTATTATGRKNG